MCPDLFSLEMRLPVHHACSFVSKQPGPGLIFFMAAEFTLSKLPVAKATKFQSRTYPCIFGVVDLYL
jgi:hypothetical protein